MNWKFGYLLIVLALFVSACQPDTPAPILLPETPMVSAPVVENSPTAPPAPTHTPAQVLVTEPAPTAQPSLQPDGSLQLVPVAQYGGSITAFAVEDDLLFTAHGPRLLVYDIQDPTIPRPLGEPFPLNWVAADLAIQDRFLYMIDRDERLFIFHAPDPETMYVNGAYEGAGSSRIFIQGEWGFTSSDACVQGACTSTLKLFALSAPATAEPSTREGAVGPDLPLTASLEVPGGILKVFTAGDYAVVAHQNGLLVASLPDLQVVREIKSEFAYDAVYRAPHLYLKGWGFMRIFDLTDPLNPVDVTPTQTGSNWFGGFPAAIIGNTLYGFETFGEFGHCWSSLVTVDMTNPVQPAEAALDVGSVPGFNCASRAQGYEDLFIVLDWNGLHLIDVSEPGLPVTASSIPNQPGTVEVVVDGFGYGPSGYGLDELVVMDLSDPYAFQAYGPFPPQWVSAVVHKDGFLFIPTWEDGLHVVDIRAPAAPAQAVHITSEQLLGPGLDAALWGDLLFVARGERGISLFDVSNPAGPVTLSGYTVPTGDENWTRTSRVAAGEGYAASLEELWRDDFMIGKLSLFTLSSAAGMSLAAQWDVMEPFLTADLLADGRTLYLLTTDCPDGECGHRLYIFDVQDLAQPVLLSTLEMPGEARAIALDGDHLYVPAYAHGLYAWNVSDPSAPVLAAHIDIPGTAVRAALHGDLLLISAAEGGVAVYSVGK